MLCNEFTDSGGGNRKLDIRMAGFLRQNGHIWGVHSTW